MRYCEAVERARGAWIALRRDVTVVSAGTTGSDGHERPCATSAVRVAAVSKMREGGRVSERDIMSNSQHERQ